MDMGKKSPTNNFDDYMRRVTSLNLGSMSRMNLPIPDHVESIAELVAEGNRLLAEEEKLKQSPPPPPPPDESKKLKDKLGTLSANPYVRARQEVLDKLTKSKRAAIEKMESEHNINNAIYREFLAAVAKRGDELS